MLVKYVYLRIWDVLVIVWWNKNILTSEWDVLGWGVAKKEYSRWANEMLLSGVMGSGMYTNKFADINGGKTDCIPYAQTREMRTYICVRGYCKFKCLHSVCMTNYITSWIIQIDYFQTLKTPFLSLNCLQLLQLSYAYQRWVRQFRSKASVSLRTKIVF